MRKTKRILALLLLILLAALVMCIPAFAVTEDEVEAAVSASSKEAVTGNVLIWFLCAVAFLKVSQKVDSFMASMGVNVGHTGGSMLSEAMLTFRAVTMAAEGVGHPFGGGRRGSGGAGASGKSNVAESGGFFKGGLIGMVNRKVTNDAVKTATSRTEAMRSVQKHSGANTVFTSRGGHSSSTSAHTSSRSTNSVHTGGSVYTGGFSQKESQVKTDSSAPHEGVIYTKSDTPPDSASRVETPLPDSTNPLGPTPQPDSVGSPPPQPDDPNIIHTDRQTDSTHHQEGFRQTGSEHIERDSAETAHSETVRTDSISRSGGRDRHTSTHSRTSERSQGGVIQQTTPVPTLGGKIFSNSLQAGGQFANDVIGMVARGDMRSTGSITGDLAAQSLQSYMGYTALGETATEKVIYSEVEIGGGRITGREVTPEHPQGIEFAMYHVDQYSKPEGDFQKVFSADGAQWYKQFAIDAVVKTPFKAPDGEIDYQKEIVKRLPTPPKRKDRM